MGQKWDRGAAIIGQRAANKAANSAVGRRLQQVRTARSLSQRELALRVGITDRMLRYYETGRAALTIERVTAFAGALKCKPTDLLREDQ